MFKTACDWRPILIGIIYILFGIIGLLLNLTTFIMLVTSRMYRLSAYTIMANLALADAFIMIVTGCACGITIIYSKNNLFSTNLIINEKNYQINKFNNLLNNNNNNISLIINKKNKRTLFNLNKTEKNLFDNKMFLTLPKQFILNYNVSLCKL